MTKRISPTERLPDNAFHGASGKTNRRELKTAIARRDMILGTGYFAKAHERVYAYMGKNVSIYSTLTRKKIGECTHEAFQEKFILT